MNKHLKEKLIKYGLLTAAVSSIVIVFAIIITIFYMGHSALFDWLAHGFGMKWFPAPNDSPDGLYGILPFMWGSIYVGIGAIAIGSAVGIPCAIYLSEFADEKFRNFVKPCLEMLNGFPSIILGLIGYTLIVTLLIRYTGQYTVGMLAGWIILAIMAIPTIVSVSEDSIKRVPHELREASLGIGATKWQTTLHVLLPSAKSGIVAAVLLALGEAIGEVMAISYVMGMPAVADISLSPFAKSGVLPSILLTATENNYGTDGPWWHSLFGAAIVLFVICALLNLAVRAVMRKSGNKKS